jgi:UDP-N-acetylglucosamine diphosphorylase/glucosamine-1-phosphate N-acetyltransferase
MRLCVFEDAAVSNLDPLTLTRPAFDLWCGAASLLQQHVRHFGATDTAALVRPELSALCRQAHPQLAVNDAAWLRKGPAVLVNARWLPPAESPGDLTSYRVAVVGDQVAYAVLPPEDLTDCTPQTIDACLARWRKARPQVAAGGTLIAYPWDLVEHNGAALRQQLASRLQGLRSPRTADYTLVGPEDQLFVGPDARVEPLVFLDTTHGPIVIERGALVKAFSRIEGPCYIGADTWVLSAQVSGSTIGPVCRIGGEVEASIVQGHSNKAHEGFLGHSYLGEWVNLAAGTQISDLRNDYKPVTMTVAGKKVETGLMKVGSFLGDHAKSGINTLVNTGTVGGAFCQLFPSNLLPPRFVPPFCIFARGQLQEGPPVEALLDTARTVMGRRKLELSSTQADFYRWLHGHTAAEREQVLCASRAKEQRPGA